MKKVKLFFKNIQLNSALIKGIITNNLFKNGESEALYFREYITNYAVVADGQGCFVNEK